jgi:hypothetical protein
MPANAVQHVRRMRGGAQSHLIRADDGHFYVVKFKNNPQHLRVLANELLATRLAEQIGLPVPRTELIHVDEWLIANTPEMRIELSGCNLPCAPGVQCGSRFVVNPSDGQVFDILPETMMQRVKGVEAFAGALAFDKWTCNCNGRQAAFWKRPRDRKYTVAFIDQGYCFNAGEWSFPDAPLRGVYGRNFVYVGVTGWDSFEPWLSRIEQLDPARIWACAEIVPPEWYGDWDDMIHLATKLVERRSRVRALIEEFRKSSREPFPNWNTGVRYQVTGSRYEHRRALN